MHADVPRVVHKPPSIIEENRRRRVAAYAASRKSQGGGGSTAFLQLAAGEDLARQVADYQAELASQKLRLQGLAQTHLDHRRIMEDMRRKRLSDARVAQTWRDLQSQSLDAVEVEEGVEGVEGVEEMVWVGEEDGVEEDGVEVVDEEREALRAARAQLVEARARLGALKAAQDVEFAAREELLAAQAALLEDEASALEEKRRKLEQAQERMVVAHAEVEKEAANLARVRDLPRRNASLPAPPPSSSRSYGEMVGPTGPTGSTGPTGPTSSTSSRGIEHSTPLGGVGSEPLTLNALSIGPPQGSPPRSRSAGPPQGSPSTPDVVSQLDLFERQLEIQRLRLAELEAETRLIASV